MTPRLKGLHEKQPDLSFGDFLPFGTDGVLVDMLSGLDNEQEFKLGGNHSADISESDNITTITEYYRKDDDNTHLGLGTIVYTVVTRIETILDEESPIDTEILVSLYEGTIQNPPQEPLNTKTVIIPKEVSGSPLSITEVLNKEVTP